MQVRSGFSWADCEERIARAVNVDGMGLGSCGTVKVGNLDAHGWGRHPPNHTILGMLYGVYCGVPHACPKGARGAFDSNLRASNPHRHFDINY